MEHGVHKFAPPEKPQRRRWGIMPVSAATLVAASWVRAGVQRPVVLVPSSFSYRHATSAGRSFAIPLVSMLDGKVG